MTIASPSKTPTQKAGHAPSMQEEALYDLLTELARRGYRFVTPTPATHARVLARPARPGSDGVTDLLGWSRVVPADAIDPVLRALLDRAGVLRPEGSSLRATIRVSSLHERLFIHSAHPTDDAHAVFFGPDSYRFADLVTAELAGCALGPSDRIVDFGAGAGVGAIVAGLACRQAMVTMVDVNAEALRLARVNARAAGVAADFVLADRLDDVAGPIALAIANPPYIVDDAGRAYRHGGGMHGAEVALDMARQAVDRLAPGGRLILYTGSAIVAGDDALRAALAELCAATGRTLRYREIDPDIFGEELDRPAYRDVDRIAIVAAVIAG